MLKRSALKSDEPFYRQERLYFECTGCGACCLASSDYHVYVSIDEIAKITAFLGLSSAWFKRRYLRRLSEEGWVLAVNTDESCIFLTEDKNCAIYAVRPQQCSSYPFWPEVVMKKRDWQREAKRCEGIGRGKAVSKKRVGVLLVEQAQGD